MSARRPTIARMHARFVGRFLAPLLGGGDLVVSRPIPAVVLDDFAAMAIPDSEVERAIAAGLDRPARALLGHPSPAVGLSRGALGLALAAHDLVAATDPLLDRALARSAIPRALDYAGALLESAGFVASREDALARHAIVSAFSGLEREDTSVGLWFGGRYDFLGRDAPPRVVALPRLRRVHEEHVRRPVTSLFEALGPDLGERARGLLSAFELASPLTDLVSGDPARPCHVGRNTIAVLCDPPLRRGIVQALAGGGMPAIGRLAGGLTDRADTAASFVLPVLVEALALLALAGPQYATESALGPFESIALGALSASLDSEGPTLASGLERRDRARLVAYAALLEPRALRDGLARGRALVHRNPATTRAHASENQTP